MAMTQADAARTSDPGTPLLRINQVGKRFTGPESTLTVLDDVCLDVAGGEFLALVGPSGCGKTTLLRIIQGLETPSSGQVEVGNYDDGTAMRMSFVFQRASLLPWYTIERNVAFGLTLAAGKNILAAKTERESAVRDLLEMTSLSRFAGYYPDQISGGMQQRVNLARALAVRPGVLLLDEPFSALDALTREKLQLDVTDVLAKVGTSAILVTHDIREAVFLADRVAIMGAHSGRIKEIVEIDHPRPRTEEFQHSPELAELENHIWKALHH